MVTNSDESNSGKLDLYSRLTYWAQRIQEKVFAVMLRHV